MGSGATRLSKAMEDLRRSETHLAEAQRLAIELRHPIAAALLYAQTCALCVDADAPKLTEASKAAAGVVKALQRANDLIERISALRTN